MIASPSSNNSSNNSLAAPCLKWPGSKWRIAEWIIGHMPQHDCYIESHFGSGATFFLKPPSACEIINDLDKEVANFFAVVRDYPDQLGTALSLTPWARAEYDFARKRLGKPRGHSPKARGERARRLAVCMWMAIGQRRSKVDGAGTCGWRNRMAASQSPVPTWQRLPQRIQVAAVRLLNAQIESRPALDVIARHADKDVLIYADPPYHHDTRLRQIYAHEMDDAAHNDLLDALEAHPGPVLLSGYDCALYESRLPHWKRFETQARAQTNEFRTEVLWLNAVAWARLQRDESTRQRQLEMQPVLAFPELTLSESEAA